MAQTVIDDFDRALLELVQENNLTPARQLAEKVGLSESAVLRRLRRLRKTGVIAKDVSIVRQSALGRPLTLIVLVSLNLESRSQVDAFVKRLTKRPETVNGWYVTGETDFVLLLHVQDMDEYVAFTEEVFLPDPHIKRFTTLVTMREIGSTSAPSKS